ncbi:UNVERIFIED_CONTAM: hypothetical protein Sangu_3201700 [Sesamum angustifolium]|uniref:Uncharacterized protein n=1 Tax=Sesamum angustifolium TaxID=2727405 RepID=A0AAW2JLT7_9LAMI
MVERKLVFGISAAVVHESLSGVKEESGAIGLPESFPWHETEKNQRNTGLRAMS